MSVKVLDAGGKLMLSGDLQIEVQAALDDHLKRGAKLISVVQKLGTSWVAACTLPRGGADTTTSLKFSDPTLNQAKPSRMTPEFDDGCKVEEIGFKHFITGPTRQAVEQRIDHLKQFGGEVVVGVEKDADSWIAVVDTGGADKAFRWS